MADGANLISINLQQSRYKDVLIGCYAETYDQMIG